MTYLDLIRKADREVDTGKITLGEYEEMIEPLKRTIESEREQGKWIAPVPRKGLSYSKAYWECSQCHEVIYLAGKMNFCPNCGADMRGGNP